MKVEANKVWFTADCHFNHANIIKYCDRPFRDETEMNTTIIERWNEYIKVNDIIFILGDFGFIRPAEALAKYLIGLNGEKHLIMGNHDYQVGLRPNKELPTYLFKSTRDYRDITVIDDEIDGGYQRIFLCHYPMFSWAGSHKNSWHLFGHIHSKSNDYPLFPGQQLCSIDVGMDANNFYPISYQDVKTIITKRIYKWKSTQTLNS